MEMKNEDVTAEPTAEANEPEINTEEATDAGSSQEEDASSEETQQPDQVEEAESAKPKRTSRASERIRELIAQKKALEQQLQSRRTTEIEGVDEDGVDPIKFADSVARKAVQAATEATKNANAYTEAERQFELVKTNRFVRSRAGDLVDSGFNPLQAAEMATIEWQESVGEVDKKAVQRQSAGERLRFNTQIPKAGSRVDSRNVFTRTEIDQMSPAEYVKNQTAIQSQLQKYGPESFEE